eukprot:TRINITY_DN12725_c0_g2_i1.p1 TRINITY_DN12725_c0_g2~~TRINITY_DN12725_c0_g2_i1.p1  ORF type:complete len:228 (-),score=30.60 TRINITY_DN12725_c0_g2_i1:479-1162(-)
MYQNQHYVLSSLLLIETYSKIVNKQQKGTLLNTGRNLKEMEYDEDGLRQVYDSSPDMSTRRIRNEWLAIPLREKIRWNQTSQEIFVHLQLVPGTKKSDIVVDIQSNNLIIKLNWAGKVLDGQLWGPVKAGESCWTIDNLELEIMLVKYNRDVWKGLFKDGEERSYMELLQELVDADEGFRKEELDVESQLLIEEMRERQELISRGEIDIEGLDDFRIVLGENSLRRL